jgi:hypothetical protein
VKAGLLAKLDRPSRNRSLAVAALLVLVGALGCAQTNPHIIYTKSFAGSVPPYVHITLEPDGTATYNESKEADDAEQFRLEKDAAAAMFDLARKLNYFKRPLESGLKVANMGAKTYRWENGAEVYESTFNYSQDENARILQDWFERITDSERAFLELDRVVKHDRLGVHQAMLTIVDLWDGRRLLTTPTWLALLDRVAQNEAFINMARERAAYVAAGIRAKAKSE